MEDYIVRATAGEGSVRVFVATTRNMVNRAFEIHKTSPVATAAIGRLLTGASIMGCMLKNDTDIITISVKGDGELGGIVVTTDNKSRVKGYVKNPLVNLPLKENGKLDVSGAVGHGTMTVTKDLGLKEPMSGQIPIVSGEIAEDLTYYFAKSEQTPSSVALGVLVDRDYTVKQAGGFIIQIMPDAKEEIISYLEERLSTLPAMTTMLEEGKTPEDILKILFGENEVKIYERLPAEYYCSCSKEKTEKALVSVGLTELKSILEEDKGANIHCHFCNADYYFDENDIKSLISKLEN